MKKHTVRLVVVAAFLLCGAHAAAAQDAFLLVPNIPGGSVDARHAGWIDVLSVSQSFDANAPRKQSACAMAIAKPLDKAGPLLWVAAATGQVFASVKLEVMRAGGEQAKYYELVLNNAVVSSISTDPIQQIESLVIQGTSATLSFFSQRPDGSAGPPVSSTVTCR